MNNEREKIANNNFLNKKVIIAVSIVIPLIIAIISIVLLFNQNSTYVHTPRLNFIVNGEIYSTIETQGNETIKLPNNPAKDGFKFDGWYWDNNTWQRAFTANSLLDEPLSSDMSVYAKFVSNEVPPTQEFVINALKTMPNIVAVSAATEYNDPNGQLNKPGGYIADIFFSIDVINQNLITGTTLVEKGTDAGGSIEIYRTQKDAEKRNEYLAAFDGGILSSGSHKVIGTCVVRTSDSLTASLQNILENNIEKALTGSTKAFVSMDTYLIEIAKQIAEEEKLSEFETGTKLIEFGYPLEKAEAIAKICGANFNEIAKGLAEGYADYYATVYPTMIAELLADHEFTEANIEYALENADIDWQFYAKIHARDFVNIYSTEYYITPIHVVEYLNNDKGYSLKESNYGVFNCNVDWNIHALRCLIHYVEDLCDTTPSNSDCTAQLKEWGFIDSNINYAIGNYTPNNDSDDNTESDDSNDGEHTLGIIYDVSSDGTCAEVIGYEGTSTNIVIASEYNGLPVKKIYGYVFEDNRNITSVVIPDTVTSIENSAFFCCTSLSRVIMGDGVEYIDEFAFYYCTSLTSITIGNGVTRIADNAFYNCPNLSNVYMGNAIQNISLDAFDDCDLLEFNMYENCKYLGSRTNPYMVLMKTKNSNFSTYKIHSDTKVIADYAFYYSSRLSNIIIPDNVISIGRYAFSCCELLTNVFIPISVKYVGENAFSQCSSAIISCEVATQPIGWHEHWNYYGGTVSWNVSKPSKS